MHDLIEVLCEKQIAHLEKVCQFYFEVNNRTLQEDITKCPFSTIEGEAEQRSFCNALLALLPDESTVKPLPFTEEARSIYTALVQGDTVDVTAVVTIVAFMPQDHIQVLADTYRKRSPLQARTLLQDAKRTRGPARHLLLKLLHKPGRSTALRVDMAAARRSASQMHRVLCPALPSGGDGRYHMPEYDTISDELSSVSPTQAAAICEVYVDTFNRTLHETIHRCCTTDLVAVWSQAACLCLSLMPPDVHPHPHEDPLPWAAKVHAVEAALRSLTAEREAGQAHAGMIFSALFGLNNVQLQELTTAYSHRTGGKDIAEEVAAVTGGPYQKLLLEMLECRQDAISVKVVAGNGATRAAALRAEKLAKEVQRLRQALTSTEASMTEEKQAQLCVDFFVNREVDTVRSVKGDYALGFEHTLEHSLNGSFHGLFLDCVLQLLER